MRLVIAAMAVALLAAPARGDEGRDEAALRQLDVGIAAYRAGDYTAARRAFEAARRLVPDKANPYRWLGMANVQLGDCTQALLAFEMFLKLVPPGDERVPEVTRLRDGCQRAPPPSPQPPVVAAPAAVVAAPAAVVAAPPPPPARKPLVRRWWFWTALGGAAAVAATGITLGVVLGAPRETRLPPIVCGTTGCAGSM
jgi:tetratricopeptide (TPR) repeat protein